MIIDMQVFLWLDIFAINQHPGTNQQNDLMGLKEVVEDADKTLMVLDRQDAVLTRIWCLYEAWLTSRAGGSGGGKGGGGGGVRGGKGGDGDGGGVRGGALGCRGEKGRLVLMSYGVELGEELKDVFLHLDVARADAAIEADKHRILADIKRVSLGNK